MKKLTLIFILLFLLILTACSSPEENTNRINNSNSQELFMPYWYRGSWVSDEGLSLLIEEHKIVMQLPDTTLVITTATQGAYSEEDNYNTLFLDDGSTMGFVFFNSDDMTVSLDDYSGFYRK